MNSTLSYKGFTVKVEFSADDGCFVGRVIDVDDIIVFDADTVKGLKERMKQMLDFYLEKCEKTGKKPKKDYSGKMLFRFDSDLHERITKAAARSGKSVNEFGKEVFESAVQDGSR